MNQYYHTFLNLLFTGLIALFPVVNPVGSAFIVNPYLGGLSKLDKRKAVKKITLYAFCICTVGLFAGHWVLELFGISIPVIQLAGGIMICKMGWEFLSEGSGSGTDDAAAAQPHVISSYAQLEDKLFYPITFPTTTGAGTLSVLFTLSAHSANKEFSHYLLNTAAIQLSIIVMCVLVYFFYFNTKRIISFLGANGERIVNRITAFLIFCVGLEIAISGIKSLIKS